MASQKILDTHIHLWPETSTSPKNHGWMTPGHFLARRHGITDYHTATSTSSTQPSGFIYVETDRYLPSLIPSISDDELSALAKDEGRKLISQKLTKWAHEPIEELKFLRRIAEGKPEAGDGFNPSDSNKMVGCVIWAPFNLAPDLFNLYLQIAEEVSGPQLWQKIVGFRYLLQGYREETNLRNLLVSQNWLQNILRLRLGRNGKGYAFDVGVDTHGGGVWQLEAAADMIEKIRVIEGDGSGGRVRFVLNHLCKPDLSTKTAATGSLWLHAMERLAALPAVYMKFSGGFNQFAPSDTPSDTGSILDRLEYYTRKTFELFGSQRVMFGSDWPVCNIGGPAGEHHNWELWRELVAKSLEACIADSEDVWWKAGCDAYGVEF